LGPDTPLPYPDTLHHFHRKRRFGTIDRASVAGGQCPFVSGAGDDGGGKVVATINSTQARSVQIPGLTPGTTYTVQACALGGTTGQSDWSDPVSHMCM